MPKKYSDLFITLAETTTLENDIGRGCHYSIFRVKDNGSKVKDAYFDFAVIWDEDHDERIISVLEELYAEKKLRNYIIVGERKGGFTAILSPAINSGKESLLLEELDADGDPWHTNVLSLDDVGNGCLIQDSKERSEAYIASIRKQHNLGKKIVADGLEDEISERVAALKISTNVSHDVPAKTKDSKKREMKVCERTAKLEGKKEEVVTDLYKGKIGKCTNEKEHRKISMYGFPSKEQAKEKELAWQKSTVLKFFKIGKPLREDKESYRIYSVLVKQIKISCPKVESIDNFTRRSFIIALSKILSEGGSMPALKFQLGITVINFDVDNSYTQRQIGNFRMNIHGIFDIAYGSGCISRLRNFIMPTWDKSPFNQQWRKKLLLQGIQKRLQTMISFTHGDFNKYGNILLPDEDMADSHEKKTQDNIHLLNGLISLITTVEVLVRLYRTKEGKVFSYDDEKAIQSDSFPVAIAQARSLILLLEGKITFTDFLGESIREGYEHEQHRAYFGAVTGKATIDHLGIMLEKLFAINSQYDELISSLDAWKDFRTEYLKDNKNGEIIEGKSRMYLDLKFVYGSGSESEEDTSDYSDSSEFDSDEIALFTPKKN